MDPSIVLIHIEQPTLLLEHSVVLPGALTPVHLPWSCLPTAVRARWLVGRDDVPLHQRVTAALDAGLDDAAWGLIIRDAAPVGTDYRIERALAAWQGRTLARWKATLPTRGDVLVLETDRPHGSTAPAEANAALTDVRRALNALPWPRWYGPVVMVRGDAAVEGLPAGQPLLARPALPIVRMTAAGGEALRCELAERYASLALALSPPPAAGWPMWLADGLPAVLRAIANGDGPSPMAMHAIRQRHGATAIRRLLTDDLRDRDLAMAVCAPLLHSRRRGEFARFLDCLRHTDASVTALEITYDLDVDRLVRER